MPGDIQIHCRVWSRRFCGVIALAWLGLVLGCRAAAGSPDPVLSGWEAPPVQARLRAYWWWLNGNVTAAAITRDLEEMKAKGFGGALICDAGGAEQDGNDRVPAGPTFFSAQWRTLYRHALKEASRLGLEMSLNIQSGWNLGGPMVTAADAPKKLVWTERKLHGPASSPVALDPPVGRDGFYQDLFVVAFPEAGSESAPVRLKNWGEKALLKPLRPFSAPDTTPLFLESAAEPGESFPCSSEVLDLTRKISPDGTLHWEIPPGDWRVLRIGCTLNDHSKVSTCSDGWQGYALDPFDAGAFDRYWNAVVDPLIDDAGPLAGTALKYLHTDSWEVEVANWTPSLRTEFRKRRGYDLLAWLPVLTGRILNSRDESNRFLHDFRRTLGDLAIDHHFRRFRDRAHARKLLIHPESGGPHAVPIDAQQCLGFNDAPMSEFWAWSWRHRIGDDNRFFVKQPASAAHVYGRRLVLAEGFTTIGPHWQERLWDNLKPSFDQALCEGLNLLVWHAFVCSPESMGIPGQQYFAGTHLNPHVTWWSRSQPFFDYINRCQWMLQQGIPVSDVAYYYGDHVPNFTQHKRRDPARVRPGYDYDVLTEEALRERVRIRDGRWTLPDGVSYALLVMPDWTSISLPVLRRLKVLVAQGGRLLGPRPNTATSLARFPACDNEVRRLARELWGPETAASVAGVRGVGRGRVSWGTPAREVLVAQGVEPDCEMSDAAHADALDYIHRRDRVRDIYFVSNRTNIAQSAEVTFRVSGREPELWDAVTGMRRRPGRVEARAGRTVVRLDFAPCGSWFVVFPEKSNLPAPVPVRVPPGTVDPIQVDGPWAVRFDPRWGGPESATFESLASWTKRAEEGIRFYSGTATYAKEFAWPTRLAAGEELWLDLGDVRELAEVRVNGKSCGVVWTPPFRVNIARAVTPGTNQLEIDVVNFWPNRIIGDASLPAGQRRTRTNVRKLVPGTPLMESGLLGPVFLEAGLR
jgi:hypothetical protein